MRLAWRLAWREVARRKGRTAMVVLLVAVTVAGITVADLAYRSHNLRDASDFGAADVRLTANMNVAGPADAPNPSLEAVLADLPDGAEVLRGVETYAGLPVQRADRPGLATSVSLSTLDLASPILRGATVVRSGRLPTAADELAVGSDVASRLQVQVGDRLQLVHPDVAFTVVGIADRAGGDTSLFAAPGYPVEVLMPGAATPVAYVAGVPDDWYPTVDQSGAIGVDYPPVPEEPAPEELLIVWLAMTLLLGVLGIVIAAAFAASGRRQLVTLGQLGATGADERFARRFLALQGAATSALGAAVGIVTGVVVAGAIGDPVLRRGAWDVRPFDLSVIALTTIAIGTLAALVPTRALAKAPVLTALAGRAPIKQVPRRQVPQGVIAIVGGLAVLGLSVSNVADGGTGATEVVLALLSAGAVLVGVCALSPVVVDRWQWLGGRRAGTVRLAVRSMVRHRARSAALVAAIAAIGAAGVAGASGVERWDQLGRRDAALEAARLDVVTIGDNLLYGLDTDLPDPDGAEASLQQRRSEVDDLVPGVQWSDAHRALNTEAQGIAFVADDTTLAALQIPRSEWALLETPGAGVRVAVRSAAVDVPQQIVVPTLTVHIAQIVAESDVADAPNEWLPLPRVLIGVAPNDLTDAQREEINNTSFANLYSGWFTDVPPTQGAVANVEYKPSGYSLTRESARWLVILGLLLLVTIIVSIGLALWAAEGRVERDQLIAVGAPPVALARMAGVRAWLIATTGGVIAVPLGWVMLWTILHAAEKSSPFPTITAVMVALAIPLLVAGGAMVSSRVAQAVRPITGSSMSLD